MYKRTLTMTNPVALRVKKNRDAMRAAGLRPIQIWVPDTRHPNFLKEAKRQSILAAKADRADPSLSKMAEQAAVLTSDWTG